MSPTIRLLAALLLAPLAELRAAEHILGPGGFKTIAAGVAALEALSFTGFSHRDYDPRDGSRTRWGGDF